jgi:hypothetical protein
MSFFDHMKAVPMPDRITRRPRDPRGYPIPWFVAVIDGKPDFKLADEEKLHIAIKKRVCWICGQPLGKHLAFVVGPISSINRASGEPPCHHDCAEYAVKACPFMVLPKMIYDNNNPNLDLAKPHDAAVMPHNPGVACIWTTTKYQLNIKREGIIFILGDPDQVEWYAQGRYATRQEVIDGLNKGLPVLGALAEKEGPKSVQQLAEAIQRTAVLLPAA